MVITPFILRSFNNRTIFLNNWLNVLSKVLKIQKYYQKSKNHFASSGYYPDVNSLEQGNGLKDIVEIIDDKVMSLMDLLERKKIGTHKEWNQLIQKRIIKKTF